MTDRSLQDGSLGRFRLLDLSKPLAVRCVVQRSAAISCDSQLVGIGTGLANTVRFARM